MTLPLSSATPSAVPIPSFCNITYRRCRPERGVIGSFCFVLNSLARRGLLCFGDRVFWHTWHESHTHPVYAYIVIRIVSWEPFLQITRHLLSTKGNFSRGAESGPPRLCSGRVWDHPSSGKNQGKLRTNQPQLTPAQDYERKRKFCVPRFVSYNQAVIWLYL